MKSMMQTTTMMSMMMTALSAAMGYY